MSREEPKYIRLKNEFYAALSNVGLEHDEPIENLIGGLEVDHLEDLMLSAYRIMKYLRKYIRDIQGDYTEAHKVPDLFTAIHLVLDIHKNTGEYKPLFLEAVRMEGVSRAAYAWLKSVRRLEDMNDDEEVNEDFPGYPKANPMTTLFSW